MLQAQDASPFWQRDGGQVAVEEISVEFKTETIYNFEVATHHNYAIGHHGYLVHNANQRWDKMKKAVTGWSKSFGDGWGLPFGKKGYRGGSHGELTSKKYRNDGLDSHHMPSKQASPLDTNDGPAIHMAPADHKRTASYGGGPGSPQQAYRDAHKALIDQGKFREAFLMDVEDIQRLFPDGKYDDAIQEAFDALPK